MGLGSRVCGSRGLWSRFEGRELWVRVRGGQGGFEDNL